VKQNIRLYLIYSSFTPEYSTEENQKLVDITYAIVDIARKRTRRSWT